MYNPRCDKLEGVVETQGMYTGVNWSVYVWIHNG